MNNKALSHVEMILSFVIFFSFLMFVYIYLVPHIKIIPDYSSLGNAEKLIISSVEMQVDFFSLALTESTSQYCFSVENFGEASSSSGVFVKDKEERTVGSAVSDSRERIMIETSGNFYYIYFSDDFKSEEADLKFCNTLEKAKENQDADYQLGSRRSEKWVSFERLEWLKEEYNADYAVLKDSLGIKQDFAFSLASSSGEVLIKADREKPVKNVLAKEEVVKVYRNNTIENDVLAILVW